MLPAHSAGHPPDQPHYYLMTEAGPLLASLGAAPGVASMGDVEIISVVELLAYVVVAAIRAPEWSGCLVFYVTDNQNTRA